jgi:hypothetical protein
MHIYDESTPRRTIWRVQINWKRERTFSDRQVKYIRTKIPNVRGVYCIYAKHRIFRYTSPDWPTDRWSRVIYIGSGWLRDRLCAHLTYKKNSLLAAYLDEHDLAYRYDRIVDTDVIDWPKTVEASLLRLFEDRFGNIPPANRRREAIPEIPIHRFIVQESPNFSFLARG